MKNLFFFILLLLLAPEVTNAVTTDSLKYGNFGKVYIYKPAAQPDALVLFVSGDGGWNEGTIKMGMQIVAQGAMVVGINISHYLTKKMGQHEKCYYPAGDFELLSLYLQKKYKFRNYVKPILMGYSSGATLVYGILAQAPANTFKGVISMGFCPAISTVEPLCTTNELKQHTQKPGFIWYLEPSGKLSAPFIVINGIDDKVCPYHSIQEFMAKITNGELIGIPKAGHGIPVQKNYLPYMIYALNKIRKSASYSEMVAEKHKPPAQPLIEKLESDLPLIVLPSTLNETKPLIFFISGDGGWTSFDESVAENLAEKGTPVIGLDAQKYFWQARTPNETAAEINKVLLYYLSIWNKKSFILCGYSFGADIIPYLITRLPANLNPLLKSAVMMSPDPEADFEIHVADMLSFGSSSDKFDVLAELKKSASKNIVCIFGEAEGSNSHKLFKATGAEIKLLPGNHHYENDFNAISNEIINTAH